MPISSKLCASLLIAAVLVLSSCGGEDMPGDTGPRTMSEVPSVSLSYRYEGDVSAPSVAETQSYDRNAQVQADFDNNRTAEILERTITSPDKKHVFAVYRKLGDQGADFRLDAYSPEGTLVRKVTSDSMAVRFPDTLTWAPDSSSLAFVAMLREVPNETAQASPSPSPSPSASPTPSETPVLDAVTGEPIQEANTAAPAVEASPSQVEPTPTAPTGILTFRTEQIYICNAEGGALKAVTQNEGLIYFYYVWAPDSSMLAALATTHREWRYLEILAEGKGEKMIPIGRLRFVEKNGRERRLDDNLTAVHPVWSPDSAKVAAGFGTQLRIYDAAGISPTQAAIPLKNQLLISSQQFDRDQARLAQNVSTDANAAPPAPANNEPLTTLPDERLLVSFKPIVELAWTADNLVYFRTADIKRMKLETDNVTSFARWHRLILSPQAAAVPNKVR